MRSRLLSTAGCVLLLSVSIAMGAVNNAKGKQSPLSPAANDRYAAFLINNLFNYYANNGDGSFNKFSTNNEGGEFLRGDGKTLVFEDGLIWGGYHKGRLTPKVGGSFYRHGLQAGPIVAYGTLTTDPVAASAALPQYRIFRVRPDIRPDTDPAAARDILETDEVPYIARYENLTSEDLRLLYVQDWNEWPAVDGAPYVDANHNGAYDPTVDVPGRPGADQTLWYVANDMNPALTNNMAGSPSIGLEMQRTIWGYRRAGALGRAIFMSTLLINKSGAPVDTMFLVQSADPDIGSGGDDLVGCDTLRNLGYAYNGGAADAMFGVAAPAVGFMLLQGPKIPSPGDSAIYGMKYIGGYRNLPMTTFNFFTAGNVTYRYPIQGPGGDIEWYRLMNARTASAGAPLIDPVTAQATKFCFSGNPVQSTDGSAGWVDGTNGLFPQDRQICPVTGPFTFAAGDTQEVVVALTANVGVDRLSSITALRSYADGVKAFFLQGVAPLTSVGDQFTPDAMRLYQNYPNPFNPATTIRYSLARPGLVHLAVFDLLGRQVADLVHGPQDAGDHEVRFNGGSLASGVYFYRLTSGSFNETRQFMLLK